MSFGKFLDQHSSKFDDKTLNDPKSVTNMLHFQDIVEEMNEDFYEPNAVNIALEHKDTTFNVMSQYSELIAQTKVDERLHCVASGPGE